MRPMLFALLALVVSPLSGCAGGDRKDKLYSNSKACDADLEKFCKDVAPGEGRGLKCIEEHWAELSEDCKMTSFVRLKLKGGPEACEPDRKKFCTDEELGGARKVKCMMEHEAELSEACKGRRPEGHKEEKKG